MLSRVLRIGLAVAVLGQIAWSFRPEPSSAQPDLEAEGRALYEANCSTCHALDAGGTVNGPSLQQVGPAAVDFMLRHRTHAPGEPRRPARARGAEVHARARSTH